MMGPGRQSAVLIALAMNATVLAAQDGRGRITGSVADTLRADLPNVEIVLRPTGRRTRTDSAGRFVFADVRNGAYSVAARKVSYAPEFYDVKLSEGGMVSLAFTLKRRVVLDTVRVAARSECPLRTLDGFFCRRRFGGGVFLDYPDIDDYGAQFTGDLFRSIKGFRVSMQSTERGVMPYPVRAPSRCVMYLVNGNVVEWPSVPLYTRELSSMELYLRPDSVPAGIQDLMRLDAAIGTDVRRCDAVVFWTTGAPIR